MSVYCSLHRRTNPQRTTINGHPQFFDSFYLIGIDTLNTLVLRILTQIKGIVRRNDVANLKELIVSDNQKGG